MKLLRGAAAILLTVLVGCGGNVPVPPPPTAPLLTLTWDGDGNPTEVNCSSLVVVNCKNGYLVTRPDGVKVVLPLTSNIYQMVNPPLGVYSIAVTGLSIAGAVVSPAATVVP